jgi:hypothetical protein
MGRAGRRSRRESLAVGVPALCLCTAELSGAAAQASMAPRVLLAGTYHGTAGGYTSVRAALALARAGDLILVRLGDCTAVLCGGAAAGSCGATAPAGAFVITAGIHLRGMNRNSETIDGTRPGSRRARGPRPARCGSGPVRTVPSCTTRPAPGAEHLTVCNLLTTKAVAGGNQTCRNADAATARLAGTDCGGGLMVETSMSDRTRSGLTADWHTNDDAPTPQSGACPAGPAHRQLSLSEGARP